MGEVLYPLEYMFSILRKDINRCVGTICHAFEELKRINLMIPEMDEKMSMEMLRLWNSEILLTKDRFKVFGMKTVRNVCDVYLEEFEDFFNSPDIVPDLKEKFCLMYRTISG
jgi:hypothetical protein